MRHAVVVERVGARLATQPVRAGGAAARINAIAPETPALHVVPHEQDAGRLAGGSARVELVGEVVWWGETGNEIRGIRPAAPAEQAARQQRVSRQETHDILKGSVQASCGHGACPDVSERWEAA